MTLREIMQFRLPENVSNAFHGGVMSCPNRYEFLQVDFEECNDPHGYCKGDCEFCWNQEYKGELTLREKLFELTNGRVVVECKEGEYPLLKIDGEKSVHNCTKSWFKFPEEIWCVFNPSEHKHNECWNAPYKGQEYIGYEILGKLDFNKSEECDIRQNVEHPSHYNAHNIEVIDFIQDWELNFCLGNVVKYICRAPYKGTQLEDLKKAREYLDFEIIRLEK